MNTVFFVFHNSIIPKKRDGSEFFRFHSAFITMIDCAAPSIPVSFDSYAPPGWAGRIGFLSRCAFVGAGRSVRFATAPFAGVSKGGGKPLLAHDLRRRSSVLCQHSDWRENPRRRLGRRGFKRQENGVGFTSGQRGNHVPFL